MPLDALQESFPQGFSVEEKILFTVQETIIYGLAEGESARPSLGFYMGVIRKIIRSGDYATSSVTIYNSESLDIDTGEHIACFRNFLITEDDPTYSVSKIMSSKFTEPLQTPSELSE